MSTKLLGVMSLSEEDTVERCWTYIQKCHPSDPTWPWTKADVEYKVKKQMQYIEKARAKKQAELDAESAVNLEIATRLRNSFFKDSSK